MIPAEQTLSDKLLGFDIQRETLERKNETLVENLLGLISFCLEVSS